MCRHGENIYKRKDGRYEGRYVLGKTEEGKTRFGYRWPAEARAHTDRPHPAAAERCAEG